MQQKRNSACVLADSKFETGQTNSKFSHGRVPIHAGFGKSQSPIRVKKSSPILPLPIILVWMRFQTLYEGRWIFAVLILLAAGLGYMMSWLAVIPVALFLFCINFFRDPDRIAPADPKAVVAAADGTVTAIEEMDETEVTNSRMNRVSIFLSVFNVHTNRMPLDGKVVYVKHFPGTYLDARNPESSIKNEAMTWGFETPQAVLVVRQITGAIARRIVAWSRQGDQLKKGERFGMIRFGSRTEIYVPLNCEITVKPGDKVYGGATVIARLP